MSKSVQNRVMEEITKGEHETLEEAIGTVVKNHPKKTKEFYFATFDLNEDADGYAFDKVYKRMISYSNELELIGELGKEVEKAGDMMVYFLSKERAKQLHDKYRQFEGITKEYSIRTQEHIGNKSPWFKHMDKGNPVFTEDKELAMRFDSADSSEEYSIAMEMDKDAIEIVENNK